MYLGGLDDLVVGCLLVGCLVGLEVGCFVGLQNRNRLMYSYNISVLGTHSAQ